MLATMAALEPWPFARSAGANECSPNPVLKYKCPAIIILCSELGIAHCSYVRLNPCPNFAQPRCDI